MLLWELGQREAYFFLAKQVDPSIDTEEKLKNYLVELYRNYTLAPLYKLVLKDNPYNWLASS